MRLQQIHDGKVYASDGRVVLVDDGDGEFRAVGRIPFSPTNRSDLRVHLLTSRHWRSLTNPLVGTVSTVNVWPLSGAALLATVGRQMYRSADGGRTWDSVRLLPASSGLMGVLPTAVEHYQGTTFLGEYPLDDTETPRVLVSDDDGASWSTLLALPDVRHVHAVQRDPYTGDYWLTTGDRDSESRIGRIRDGEFDAVGSGSQQWRAVELAFTPTAILWGMDCAYATTNPIYKLDREQLESDAPVPTVVAQTSSSVFYSATIEIEDHVWVAFSTAMEVGRDQTGPSEQPTVEGDGSILISSSASGYTDWHELATFRRRRPLADRLPWALSQASGYVFLQGDSELGLIFNPYNTDSGDATIQRIPLQRLQRRQTV